MGLNGGMSDIGPIPALEKLMIATFVVILLGPPLILGVIFLLLHIFLPGHGRRWTVLYFVTSVAAVIGTLWWTSEWLALPDVWEFSPLIVLASSGGVFAIFLGVCWLIGRITSRSGRLPAAGDASLSRGGDNRRG
jgi:hypothetical protein